MKTSVIKNSSHQKIHITNYWKGHSDLVSLKLFLITITKKREKVGFKNFKLLLENHFHEDHFKLYV